MHRRPAHGFWRMSAQGRSLVHADGTPAVLVGDTAGALPWRATEDDVCVYAADGRQKGFNAVLVMRVQPGMDARGPRDRTADHGIDMGFEDPPEGHGRGGRYLLAACPLCHESSSTSTSTLTPSGRASVWK
ncbi:apiosidase-like domain-containing protein [Streptomyces brasiliensis]|uniref:apiosidase-like domain-containing protein n=1 Tax=Streptomyces brasiliensis TaxID=1954 RepID=UPI001E48BA39|nr:DUF4038 domain-containing protein [Streptomyces brasiliensis]